MAGSISCLGNLFLIGFIAFFKPKYNLLMGSFVVWLGLLSRWEGFNCCRKMSRLRAVYGLLIMMFCMQMPISYNIRHLGNSLEMMMRVWWWRQKAKIIVLKLLRVIILLERLILWWINQRKQYEIVWNCVEIQEKTHEIIENHMKS